MVLNKGRLQEVQPRLHAAPVSAAAAEELRLPSATEPAETVGQGAHDPGFQRLRGLRAADRIERSSFFEQAPTTEEILFKGSDT